MSGRLVAVCSVLIAAIASAQEADKPKDALAELLNHTFLEKPIKIVAGFQDGGLGATANGDYASSLGKPVDIAVIGRSIYGYTYGVDGAWNSKPKKPDQVEFSGGLGLIELNPGFPRFSVFLRVLGKNGQVEKYQQIQKVNQVLTGFAVEYVPRRWSEWTLDKVSTTNFQCAGLPPEERAKRPDCQILTKCAALTEDERGKSVACKNEPFSYSCYGMTEEEARQHPECAPVPACMKLSFEDLPKHSECKRVDRCLYMTKDERAKHGICRIKQTAALEAPPKFTIGYYHPFRTDGNADLPEKIEADKVTATFEADSTVFSGSALPIRFLANLSATYATRGDHKTAGKIDVGFGLPRLTDKVVLKYVSGEKDGFKYDRAIILGVVLQFAQSHFAQ